jgi:hypothetical protein
MNQVTRNALMKPDYIGDVLLGWKNRASKRTLGKYLPINEVNQYTIELEVELVTRGGMTPLSSIGAEAPTVRFAHARSGIEYQVPVWKEKTRIDPIEIYNLRKLGTHEQLETAERLLSRKISLLEERLQNRLEFMRRELLFDKQVTATDAVGNVVEYVYNNHPDFLNVSASNFWDDDALADPHVDILEWKDIWFEHTVRDAAEVILPFGAMRKMAFIQSVRDYAMNNWASFKEGTSGLEQIFQLAFAGIPVTENKDRISYTTMLAADAASGQADVVLYGVDGLAPGMNLRLVNILGAQEVGVVDSISGNTVTLVDNLANSYTVNSGAIYHIWTIPLNKMLIMGSSGEVARDTSGELYGPYDDSRWAEITSTLALDANMKAPRPGLFSFAEDHSDKEVAYMSYMLGVHAIPRIIDGNSWMVAQIFA